MSKTLCWRIVYYNAHITIYLIKNQTKTSPSTKKKIYGKPYMHAIPKEEMWVST